MRELFRSLPLMCAVLLIPVLPFLLFGGRVDDAMQQWLDGAPDQWATAAVVVGLLATDIFLPVPSSMINTAAGWQLGWLAGTAAAWIGMNIGAILGFALARRWGRPMALWLSKEEDLQRMRHVSEKYGPFVLALTRAVPVFAEASVLIVGIHRLSWRRFLPSVVLSNLGVAVAYAAFGDVAKQHQWLPLALAVSIALPVLIAAAAQRWLPNSDRPVKQDETDA